MIVGVSDRDPGKPLLHVCFAPTDEAWVRGRMVRELGLRDGQYRTRADDAMGELQLAEIARAVEECRFTVLIASSTARWDRLAQFAAGLAQHASLAQDQDTPRLVVIARNIASTSGAARAQLPLEHRALVGLDCSDDAHTTESLARLRRILTLDSPIDARPACPYPGLERFTAANRDLLFGRDRDKDALLQRVRAHHTRILVVGPSGSGKSSLIHAAVLPELAPRDYVVALVPRGGDLVAALRATIDALEVPRLGAAIDRYLRAVPGATDAELEVARTRLRVTLVPDERRRVVVIDPLEEVFASDNPRARETLFHLLTGLWSVPWCTVILCVRADFYGALMALRCWRELETSQYLLPPLDEAGLVAAIVEPARRAGVHVDATLVERLIREIDRDRSSVPLPLLQVALKELWAHLRWRYLAVADYEHIVNHDQRGLGAVLAVHAEAVIQSLTAPGDHAVAQRILLDLVHLGEGRPHTRRPRTRGHLGRSGDAPDQLERVLETLVQGRLVTTSDGDQTIARRGERHVDLAHDTLITGWPALASWIAERRDDLRTQRRFEARAAAGGSALGAAELSELTHWIATPAGIALGVSEAVRALRRRSIAARRFRRGALGAGLAAVTSTAIVFAVQTRQLREEQTRTHKSISMATEAARLVVFELDDKLKTVACAGAAEVREISLKSARDLLTELRTLGELDDDAQRIVTLGKTAQADLARERGRLSAAYALYQEVLHDTQGRAAAEPGNARWQSDLAGAYQKLGEVAVTAGRLDDSRAWFDKALTARKTLAAADPNNAGWQRTLSLSYQKLGDVVAAAGTLDEARVWFDRALAVSTALAATDPRNPVWRHDLWSSYNKHGELDEASGKLHDARVWFETGLATAKELATADPDNVDRQRDLAISYAMLGDVAVGTGTLDDAGIWREKAIAIFRTLADADPGNAGRQRDLAISYLRLGEVAMGSGRLDDARASYDRARAACKTLAAADPGNTDVQRDLAASYDGLGGVAMILGKLDDARAWFEQSLAVSDALATVNPRNDEWQRNLSVSYWKLGDVALASGELDQARSWLERCLAIDRRLAAADRRDLASQRTLAADYQKSAEAALAAGDLDRARDWFEHSHAILERLTAADPSDATFRGDLSLSEESLGDLAVAAGKLDQARVQFDKSLTIRRTLAAANPANVTWQAGLSASYQKLGEVAMAAGKLDDARAWFHKTHAIRSPLAATNPGNAGWQRDLCTTFARMASVAQKLGEATEYRRQARVIYEQLQRDGLFRGDARVARLGAELDQAAAYVGRATAH
jgi:tetratricopeptide (TPR) repeat protein